MRFTKLVVCNRKDATPLYLEIFISAQPFKHPILAQFITVMIHQRSGFTCLLLALKLWMLFSQDTFVASDIRAYIHVSYYGTLAACRRR